MGGVGCWGFWDDNGGMVFFFVCVLCFFVFV